MSRFFILPPIYMLILLHLFVDNFELGKFRDKGFVYWVSCQGSQAGAILMLIIFSNQVLVISVLPKLEI